jgi:hypothetical protein
LRAISLERIKYHCEESNDEALPEIEPKDCLEIAPGYALARTLPDC